MTMNRDRKSESFRRLEAANPVDDAGLSRLHEHRPELSRIIAWRDAFLARSESAEPLTDSDWLDIRSRALNASPSLFRRVPMVAAAVAVVVAVVAAGVLAAPGWGLASKILDLFNGDPATPDVQQAIHESDVGAPPGMAPGIEADKTHKLVAIQLADGRQETFWVAPSRSGGVCIYLQRGAMASPGAGCGPAEPPPGRILWGLQGHTEHDTAVVLYGQVPQDVVNLALAYSDGTVSRLPLTKGFFLYEIPASQFAQGKRPSLLVGENQNGDEVTRASLHPDSFDNVFSVAGRNP
jgi:hypothetical protein